ncbi:MAG: hypothetical protein FWF99_05080 [Desulfovibrionaceae bacterium]|nr:hypothetical protein [Desulfovibrionaceae bacterium]
MADVPPRFGTQLVITPEEQQRLLRVIPGTPLRDPDLIKTVLLESRSISGDLKKLVFPGMSLESLAESILSISNTHRKLIGPFEEQGRARDEVYGAYRAALTLALDSLQLTPGQERELYGLVSGPRGVELGRGFVNMADLGYLNKTEESARLKVGLLGGVSALDNLRLILGPRVGERVEEDPFYYAEDMDVRDVPGVLFQKAEALGFKSVDFPGYAALSLVSPKLTHAQWDALLPLLRTVGQGFTKDKFSHDQVLKMVAVNARELLAALEANRGRPLSPAQIWRAVIGGSAPRGLTEGNLGPKLLQTASTRLFQKSSVMFPDSPPEYAEIMIPAGLGESGLSFQTMFNACRPGGRISLEDLRFGPPTMSSLSGHNEQNAYGLVTDFRRRQTAPDGTPSTMTIRAGGGNDVTIAHQHIPDEENNPDNPIFTAIMEHCRGLCGSEPQFRRVMQSLSQAGTIHLRMLSEKAFAGTGKSFSEHSHMNSTVSRLDNGSVVVELANGPDDRPFGGRIQITVSPDGEAEITEMSLELRG